MLANGDIFSHNNTKSSAGLLDDDKASLIDEPNEAAVNGDSNTVVHGNLEAVLIDDTYFAAGASISSYSDKCTPAGMNAPTATTLEGKDTNFGNLFTMTT